ncbi:hypothetical protein E5676_scaffold302G00740 [Cucumis melo var. makuwa]|uniref:Ubiquitin-like protease family profile domain-containing protein n=1 Tax=Cucumis melo var. makuwa TaxID=1194695 RepID=A0A5D3CK53_CUCMM|nr:hypothetical protein E5676_scaffold302G00740 [Cucumis melo var. makuwa]
MHHVWSCMYLSGLKVIKSQVFESQMARIQEIDPTDDEHAYLDQSVEIPTTEGYVEDPPAPISHHVERSLTPPHPTSTHLEVRLDRQDEYLDRMQSSFTIKLSGTKELLMVLVNGKVVESQQYYEVVKHIDDETGTSISEDTLEIVSYQSTYLRGKSKGVKEDYEKLKDAFVVHGSPNVNHIHGRRVMEELPDYDKVWIDVDYIYIPYNFGGCHWILVVLDMVEGRYHGM